MATLRIKDENGNWQLVTSPASSGGGGSQFELLAENIPISSTGSTGGEAIIDLTTVSKTPLFIRFCLHFPYGDSSATYITYDVPFKCFIENEDEVMLGGDTKGQYSLSVIFVKEANFISLMISGGTVTPISYVDVYGYGY